MRVRRSLLKELLPGSLMACIVWQDFKGCPGTGAACLNLVQLPAWPLDSVMPLVAPSPHCLTKALRLSARSCLGLKLPCTHSGGISKAENDAASYTSRRRLQNGNSPPPHPPSQLSSLPTTRLLRIDIIPPVEQANRHSNTCCHDGNRKSNLDTPSIRPHDAIQRRSGEHLVHVRGTGRNDEGRIDARCRAGKLAYELVDEAGLRGCD
jgi:hypothetical protein